jgi:hypothetical protein
MKKIKNFLPEDVANSLFLMGNSIIDGTNKNKYNFWTNKIWQPQLVKDSSLVLCIKLEDDLHIKVIKSLIDNNIISKEDFLNNVYNIGAALYIWTKESYISLHSDKKSDKALTVYLNKDWDVVDGGLFLWNNQEDDEWKVVVPEFNLSIINENNLDHMTTPVKANEKIRMTLQVFLSKKEKEKNGNTY